MIRFADKDTAPLVRSMWKTCFGDSESYMDLYFSSKYKNENTLIYFLENKPVASLQMLPYKMSFYREIIPISYLAGLCTLPEYRGRGYMGALINEAYKVMFDRNIDISILVPAEDSLYGYYIRYNFVQTFESSNTPILLEPIFKNNSNNTNAAFFEFNETYQQTNFTVLKDQADFVTILEENKMDGYSPKYNLGGMSTIIKPLEVLYIYANANPNLSLEIEVFDNWTNQQVLILVHEGKATQIISSTNSDIHKISVDIPILTKLLFGFHLKDLSTGYSSFFEEHHPIINLMLE